jgi:TolA-binding protein
VEVPPESAEPVVEAPAQQARKRVVSARARAPRRFREASAAPAEAVAPPSASEPALETTPVSPAEATPAASPDLALYREAHRLHFKAQEHARALAGWEAYLARFPAGMFAAEARYNRAICLVRLGRRADAIQALEPFAAGQVAGGYRQRDARKLMDALGRAP